MTLFGLLVSKIILLLNSYTSDYKNETRQNLVIYSIHFYHAKHMQYYFVTCTDFMQFYSALALRTMSQK